MRQYVFAFSMFAAVCLCSVPDLEGQQRAIEPDLARLASGRGLQVLVTNRTVIGFTDGTRQGLRLSEGPGEGPVYLEGVEFANGTIELVMYNVGEEDAILLNDKIDGISDFVAANEVSGNSTGKLTWTAPDANRNSRVDTLPRCWAQTAWKSTRPTWPLAMMPKLPAGTPRVR